MQKKVEKAIRRSLPMLSTEMGNQVQAMLTPQKLRIICTTMAVLAEYAKLQLSVTREASELYNFITMSIDAKSEADLKDAAHHFANAVNLSGMSTISTLLLPSFKHPVVSQRRSHFTSIQRI